MLEIEMPAGPVEQDPGARPALPVARVLVDTGLAHLDRPFEYTVPVELDERAVPGARVKVRFAGQDLGGYLLERVPAAEHEGRLAPLRTVVSDEAVLVPHVLQTAQRLAREQAGTVMDVLRLAVPPRHARAERSLAERAPEAVDPPDAPDAPPVSWTRYRAGAALWSRLSTGQSPRAALLTTPSHDPLTDWPRTLADAALATAASGRGSVLVVPDRRDLDRVDAALLAALGPDRHVVLHADQGPQARYTAWLKVLRGHVRVVVGTRAAAFAPVHDLGLVAWWDDGDDLHVEPRAPYHHVRQVLLARAELAGAAALVAGPSVSTDVVELVERGELVAVGGLGERTSAARVRVAGEGHDAERDGPAARAHIPSAAWRTARAALDHGPVLVQVPRRGYVPATRCATCRAPARCATCHGPLSLPGSGGQPVCGWCHRRDESWSCPECDGRTLRASVVGARRTSEEIGRAFPGVPVVRSGAPDVVASVPARPAIVVATPGAEPVAEGGYAAALLLDAWALLDRPSLRASEESVRRWLGAAALVRSWADGGEVVLAGAPEHAVIPAVEALVRWDPAWFAARELAERAELDLPPAAWAAQVLGSRDHLREVRDGLLALGAEVSGPAPTTGAGAGAGAAHAAGPHGAASTAPAREEHLVVRVPRSADPGLVEQVRAHLAGLRATESGRKVADPVRVRVGPHVLD
ncbi:primosome assembly protein PriA [Janibacter melonis]|uniref:primosomal protein N' family DNA-binding protein n=1 Tax=Janibacter melonis TaxID=262209 RepID=UPI00209555A1|nr:primosome assembly protein PriA [Janibacter melonis]